MRVIPGPLSPLRAHPHPVLLAPLLTCRHTSLLILSFQSLYLNLLYFLDCLAAPRLHPIFSQVSTWLSRHGSELTHLLGTLAPRMKSLFLPGSARPPVLSPASISASPPYSLTLSGGSTQERKAFPGIQQRGLNIGSGGQSLGTLGKGDDGDSPQRTATARTSTLVGWEGQQEGVM